MSLISKALEKAESQSPVHIPLPSKPSPRRSGPALFILACLALAGLFSWTRMVRHPVQVLPAPEKSQPPLEPVLPNLAAANGSRTTSDLQVAAVPAAEPLQAEISKTEADAVLLSSEGKPLVLQGILREKGGRSLALIGERALEEGETVGGAKLIRIGQNEVDLEKEGKTVTLKPKD